MKQKIVFLLAFIMFGWMQLFAQQLFFTPDEIMTKVIKGENVKGAIMKVTVKEIRIASQPYMSVTNLTVKENFVKTSIVWFKSTTTPIREEGTYVVVIVNLAKDGFYSGLYNLTYQLYVKPEESDCNRHYSSAVKFVVDTPAIHPFAINSSGGSVIFASGNLQYCPARDEWRFALRQFDRVGNGKSVYAPDGLKPSSNDANANVTTVFYDSIDYTTSDPSTPSKFKEIKGVPCNNLLVSKTYGGWVDLFAWGTSGNGRKAKDSLAMFFSPYDLNSLDFQNTYNLYCYGPSFDAGHGPGSQSNDIDVASGANQYFDWGYNNAIREYHGSKYDANNAVCLSSEGSTMYMPKVWRTLTAEEWKYLLLERMVDGNDSAFTYVRLKYGKNATDTVSGVLIYPSDFSFSEAGVAALPFGANYGISEIDANTWEALEAVGVVFLPGAYFRDLTNGVPSINERAFGIYNYYWSSTAFDAGKATYVRFGLNNRSIDPARNDVRYKAFAVRLVQDVTPTVPPVFSVSATQKVDFSPGNLQYRASDNTWRFAPNQYDQCLDNNSNISADYDGWIDFFGWGSSNVEGSNPPYNASTTNTDYSWSEWGQNVIGDYPSGTWRTPTNTEWKYLFQTRRVNGDYGYSYVHIKYGTNDGDTVIGCLIYPDNFTWTNAGVQPIDMGASIRPQYIDATTWKALEKVGCVLLPCSGYRASKTFYPSTFGYYWSSTATSSSAYDLWIMINGDYTSAPEARATYRTSGKYVRLIKNAQ